MSSDFLTGIIVFESNSLSFGFDSMRRFLWTSVLFGSFPHCLLKTAACRDTTLLSVSASCSWTLSSSHCCFVDSFIYSFSLSFQLILCLQCATAALRVFKLCLSLELLDVFFECLIPDHHYLCQFSNSSLESCGTLFFSNMVFLF